ncbi:MAG TPA: T9SS type A sorting domain-containing protein [Flavobacteriales bacterium]|nr:T9SS type A sorting domain-containing protein [Flavobacteriales bacterium]
MNRKTALAIVFAVIFSSANSQVSLDSSEFPLVGTVYSLSNVAFVNIPPVSASGPGQTYDFTGGFIYDAQLIQYNDATADLFSADYPTATLSRYIPGLDFDQYLYYATDSSGFWQKGMVWVGYIIDTNQIDTLFFHYNAPNEDTLLSSLYTYGYSDSTYALSELTLWLGLTQLDFYSHVYKKIDADGWGTMETGYGTYDSVLRVHVTEYKYDSVFILGSFDNATLDTIDYHLYYEKGVRHPLVKDFTTPFVDVQGTDTTLYFVTEVVNVPPPPPIILGCTDTAAVNYNPLANQDDGSCVICSAISYTLTPDTYICEGSIIALTVTGGNSYIWSTGDTTSSITVSPNVTTTYAVLINDSQYCWEQAAVEITVYNDVVADFWNDSPSNTDSTTFVNLSAGATTFFWDFGDGNTSTDASPTHFYGALGSYNVTLIASNSCFIDTLIVAIEVALSIPGINGDISDLKVVPNPVIGSATVVFDLASRQESNLEIVDVLGREVSILNKQRLEGGHHEIDISEQVSGQLSGVYFIRLRTEEGVAYFKWIKQ